MSPHHQMNRSANLNIIIRQRFFVFQCRTGKNQLLIRHGNLQVVLDLLFHGTDGIHQFNIQRK